MHLTLKAINDQLTAKGYRVRVERGGGYFYVYGGEASDWLDRVIRVSKLSSLTLDQWVSEVEKLRKLNREVMGNQRRKSGMQLAVDLILSLQSPDQ